MDLLDLRKPFNAGAQALGTERRALRPAWSEALQEPLGRVLLPREELVLFDDGTQLPLGTPEALPWHRHDTSLPVDSIDLLAPQWCTRRCSCQGFGC